MSSFLYFALLLSLAFGCQRLNHDIDKTALICGVESHDLQSGEILIQLKGPYGEALNKDQSLGAKARVITREGTVRALMQSPRGCLRLPQFDGLLQVLAPQLGWSVSQRLPIESDSEGLISVVLGPAPWVLAQLECPEAGYVGDEAIDWPLHWSSNGSLQASRIEIYAEEEGTARNFSLYIKKYGEDGDSLPSQLSTKDLPEGRYRLRMTAESSVETWDQPFALGDSLAGCFLTVIHQNAKP